MLKQSLQKLVLCLAASGISQAAITITSSEPTTNVLLDGITGASVATIINASAAQGARGSFFTLGTGGTYEISGITIQANGADTFSTGETFTIAIYSGTPGTFAAAGSFGSVTPAYLDTNSGLSLVGSEIFTATTATGSSAGTGQVASSEFVTFNFSSDITVDGGVNLALVVFSNFAFSQLEGNNNGGGRFQFRETTTELASSGSRDMRFSVLGVPEPSVALLGGLSLFSLLRRRRD